MTDRLSEIERLQRLRADGALSDAEFEAEKSRLLATAAPGRSGTRGIVALGIGAIVLVGGGAWWLSRDGGGNDGTAITAAPTPMVSPAPSASVTNGERLALAEKAAFPEGRGRASAQGSEIVYEPGILVDAPFGLVLVNEGRVPDAAHVESGYVAVQYLKAVDRGFRVVKSWPEAIKSGSFGQMSEMAVSRKFSELPVVYTNGGGTWQGYTCAWTTLTELRPEGPVELANIMTTYDDSGATVDREAVSTEGKIADIVPGKSFKVRFTGTRRFDADYVRKGNAYVLQGGEQNALQGC